MTSNRTWVVVADGGRARVFSRTGNLDRLVPIPDLTLAAELPSSHEIGRDRPGRVHEAHGSSRHAIEPRTDPHKHRKVAFITGLAASLEDRLVRKEFDSLILVAPPTILGQMRAEMSARLRDRVFKEIPKDLTKIADSELMSHID